MEKELNTKLNLPMIECDKEIDRLFVHDEFYRVGEVAERLGTALGKNLLYRFLRKIDILSEDNSITTFSKNNTFAIDDTYTIPGTAIISNVPRLSITGIKYMWRIASRANEFIPAFLWTHTKEKPRILKL